MLAVKNVKELKSLSHETRCFTASIYFDGKKVGTAENRGHGGNTMIYPIVGKRDTLAAAEEWAKDQPDQVWDVEWQDEPMIVESDLELLVDDLVDKYQFDKEWKRRCRNKTYFRLEGDEEGLYRTINHQFDDCVISNQYTFF